MEPQLKMAIMDMSNLPELNIPEGYELQSYKVGMEKDYEDIINESFGGEHNFTEEVAKNPKYKPENVFFICKDGAGVATATAYVDIDGTEGYLHMVGGKAGHKGKGLGYQVCLACLLAMKDAGMESCILTTDDFRLPAIVTYLKLGFQPVIEHESHTDRWKNVMEELEKK